MAVTRTCTISLSVRHIHLSLSLPSLYLFILSSILVSSRADSIGSLEELVQCGICLERLSQPRMLPCQHTFCLSCLESDVTTEGKTTAHCHTCDGEYTLERGAESLDEFPGNVYINSLLKLLESSVEPQTPGPNDASAPRCVKCEIVCLLEGHKCDHCKQVLVSNREVCRCKTLEHIRSIVSQNTAFVRELVSFEIVVKLNR